MLLTRIIHQRLWWLTVGFILLAYFSGQVTAQETSPAPVPSTPPENLSDLTFPIPELGSCTDPGSCLHYCDDPVNYNSCVEYAKTHGFYESDKIAEADETLYQGAKDELGCESFETCQQVCDNPTNHDKCDAFAKREEVIGGYVDEPDKPEYLEIAKNVLGCDSLASCRNVCDDPVNADKCDAFAKQVGLLGGTVEEGPGGCTSESTCKSFCSDPNNFAACASYAPPATGGRFQGPGGCDSPTGCRTYCEEHPSECRSYAPGSNGVYVPVACPAGNYFGPGGVCTPVEKSKEATECSGTGKFWAGSSCQDTPPPGVLSATHNAFFQSRPDMGNCKTPGECYDYCTANPGKCGGFDPSYPRPDDTYIPSLYYTPGTPVTHDPVAEMGNCNTPGECYDWCKENPGKCGGFDPKAPRPLNEYVPGAYYTPPADYVYGTPPTTNYYVTPVYYTPPEGSNYTTPSYYTPGHYVTPAYYTPPTGSNYTTPTYYTPGTYYYTPSGEYPTPNYPTPIYYTPPGGTNYTTPSYYTPPTYLTPYYYTPPEGSNYTTPTYLTPPPYLTPTYYTPYTGGTYTTPIYYTPPTYTTPTYYTPPPGSTYTSPTYYTPYEYVTPNYYTPGYYTPGSYTYPTPGTGYTYPSPTYYTPGYSYPTPGSYTTPGYYTPGETYTTPAYSYPTPGSYSYPTPGSYSYPTPGSYYTPYGTPSYGTPSYSTPAYGTPAYGTPTYETPSYGTPSYGTPTYETPTYGTPSYGTPSEGGTQGATTNRNIWDLIKYYLFGK